MATVKLVIKKKATKQDGKRQFICNIATILKLVL